MGTAHSVRVHAMTSEELTALEKAPLLEIPSAQSLLAMVKREIKWRKNILTEIESCV